MKPDPEVIELDYDELHAKLNQIEATMGAELARPFRQLLAWYTLLLDPLRQKTISIQRLRKIIFGSSTERTSLVLSSETGSADPAGGGQGTSADTDTDTDTDADGATPTSDSPDQNSPRRPRRKGHGRTPAEAYTGCAKLLIMHGALHPGDTCRRCGSGTMCRQSNWSPVVRLRGQPPVIPNQVFRQSRWAANFWYNIKTSP